MRFASKGIFVVVLFFANNLAADMLSAEELGMTFGSLVFFGIGLILIAAGAWYFIKRIMKKEKCESKTDDKDVSA